MNTLIVMLYIFVISLSESNSRPPTKRQTYLINTPQLEWNKSEPSSDTLCKEDDTSIYAKYIAAKLKSIDQISQKNACEKLIDSLFYKALAGELTYNTKITGPDAVRTKRLYVFSQNDNLPSTQTAYTQPPIDSQDLQSGSNKDEIYLINAENIQLRDTNTSPITKCSEDEDFIYAKLIVTRVNSIEDKTQKSLYEQLIELCLSKALLGELSGSSRIQESLETSSQTPQRASTSRWTGKLQEYHIECQADPRTYVDEALLFRADSQNNRQVQIHSFCLGVKEDLITPNGIIRENIVKSRLETAFESEKVANEIYSKCAIYKKNKEETYTYFWACLYRLQQQYRAKSN